MAQDNRFADVKGRVAIVTGGASGIGKGIARHFAREGMQVVIADVERGALDTAADELGAIGILTDVSDLASVQALRAEVERRFGRLDILCNNAGVGPKSSIVETRMDDWRWLIDVNLWGVIHGLDVFLPMLRANPDEAQIVNTASIGGFVTGPGVGVYGATKAAVVAISEALAWELRIEGSRVGVSILAPGPVRTGIFHGSRNRPPERAETGMKDVDAATDPLFVDADWMEPDAVGPIVLEAIRANALYVATHPAMAEAVATRMANVVAGLRKTYGAGRPTRQPAPITGFGEKRAT